MASSRAVAAFAILALALCAQGSSAAPLGVRRPHLATSTLAEARVPGLGDNLQAPVQLTPVNGRPQPLPSLTTRVDGRVVRHLLATQETLSA